MSVLHAPSCVFLYLLILASTCGLWVSRSKRPKRRIH